MKKGLFGLGAGLLTAGLALWTARKLARSLTVLLENRSGRTLDIFVGTDAAPDAMTLWQFAPGATELLRLTQLPLLEHDAVYIRFAESEDHPSFKRTLIYDVDEAVGRRHIAIVDYGNGMIDLKVVR